MGNKIRHIALTTENPHKIATFTIKERKYSALYQTTAVPVVTSSV